MSKPVIVSQSPEFLYNTEVEKMLLVIDIGNTNITIGCMDTQNTCFVERLSTVHTKTALEYAIDMKNVFDLYGMKSSSLKGCMISSVVPQLTEVIKQAVRKVFGMEKRVLVLGPGIKTGLNIKTDNPGQVGADLVASAVAGLGKYHAPMIIIDMGTATTASVIDHNRQYIGGMIMPGAGISLEALVSGASQLSSIGLEAPKHVIGTNTIDCMKSGILYSSACSVDGIIDRIEEELGEKTTVIATGEYAKKILPFCRKKILLEEDLLLQGLQMIYERNNI